jgi:multidrug efflux pump
VLVSLGLAGGAFSLLNTIPQEYAPVEDQGTFNGMMQAPEGVAFEHMLQQALLVEDALVPYVESGLIQRGVVGVPGWGGGGAGIVNVTLRPWNERETTTQELMERLSASWEEIADIRVMAFQRSGIGGSGGGAPVQLVIGGPNYEELARWRDIIMARAAENPGLQRLDSDLRETQPQVLVRVDTDRAASLGVSARSIGQALQTMMTERQVTTYVVDGEEYDVILQARPDQRATHSDLRNIFVRSDRTGQLIPLSNLVRLEEQAGPSQLIRHNRTRAVTISANLAPGYSLGDALDYPRDRGAHRAAGDRAGRLSSGESLEYKEASGALPSPSASPCSWCSWCWRPSSRASCTRWSSC